MLSAAALSSASAGSAHAEFTIESFSADVNTAAGELETRAGVHPYSASTSFSFNTVLEDTQAGPDTIEVPEEHVKDVVVDLPPGFIGDPTAVPRCTRFELTIGGIGGCPVESQVGLVRLRLSNGIFGPPQDYTAAVFNLVPRRGEAADFAFFVNSVPIHVSLGIRSDGDYGVRASISNISRALPVVSSTLTLWGKPGDPSHDPWRGPTFRCETTDGSDPSFCSGGGHEYGGAQVALLSNPTLCSPPLETRLSVTSWEHPDVVRTAVATSPGPTGCDALTFAPSLDARPTSTQADAPTGLTATLTVPQNDNPNGLATPTLREAVVVLPEGVSLSPSAADGLTGCSDAQIGIGTRQPVACAGSSKVGEVTIDTPLLDEPLIGSIYIGQPIPGTPYRIFLAAENAERGVSVRLEGVLRLDALTGQVTATFAGNPPLPFSRLVLRFKDGPRAPLATPQSCGQKTTISALTPYAAPGAMPASSSSSFVVSWDGQGAGCPALGFRPSFSAGTLTPRAGGDSAFALSFGRDDREQYLSELTVSMPRGLTGVIASVPLCGEAQAAAGSCGESSRVGRVLTAAGPGATPLQLGGGAYLTGPYKGAPFGLSIVVPARAGPYDLGLVVVRASIFVDRNTAELRIVSDPLPTILEGIPLRIRSVQVVIDRERFMRNPTNCTPMRVSGRLTSTAGAVAETGSRFQVGDCAALPFTPKMTLEVGAKGKLTRGKRTPLEVTLAMTRGQANNRSVQVTLPLAINARLDVINKRTACTQAQYDADRCANVVGTATAVTPLLRDPLRGNAYFVYNPARRLPDLVVRLKGQVDFDLVGKVSLDGLKLRTTFDTVPDVPITKFRLRLASGRRSGPVGLTRNACLPATRRALKASLRFVAQNGRSTSRSQTIKVVGCGRARALRSR